MSTDPTHPIEEPTQLAGSDAAAAPEPLPARIGRYEIRSRLGAGGMGTVYRAFDPVLAREVALKTLRGPADADLVERFLREARSAARLKHPGIVAVHDQGSEGAVHFFTMDIVEGKSFADAIVDGRLRGRPSARLGRRPLLLRDAVQVVADVARAVGYAHAQGIVHRDLKPANVLLDADGRPHVSDFGLAKDASAAELTRSGDVFGTPYYMSPEQAEGRTREVGPRSDVFSLGAMLYEAVTCRHPFEGANARQVCRNVVESDPAPPRSLDDSLPRDLDTICMKSLEKLPQRRYRDGVEMANDLDHFLAGEPIAARPAGVLERAQRTFGRHVKLVLGLSIAFVVIAVIGWIAVEEALRETAAVAVALARARDAEDSARATRGEAEEAAWHRVRGLYQDVVGIDRTNAEAWEGDARAEKALRRIYDSNGFRSTEDLADRARGTEGPTLEVLALARLARADFRALEAAATDDGLSPEARKSAVDAARERLKWLRESNGPFGEQDATCVSLDAWTGLLSGDEARAGMQLQAARRMAPRLPFAALAEALSVIADAPVESLWPTFAITSEDAAFGASPLADPAGTVLARRVAAIGEGLPEGPFQRDPVFAPAYAGVRGLQALLLGRLAEAEGKLSLTIADENLFVFEAELRRIRAGIRYAIGDIEGGLADVAVAREIRPGQAALRDLEGLLLWAKARRQRTLRRDPRPFLKQAAAAFADAGSFDAARIHAVRVAADIAHVQTASGEDSSIDLDGTLAGIPEVLARHPGDPEALLGAVEARIRVGEAIAEQGMDPRLVCESAVADLVKVQKARRGDPTSIQAEAYAWLVVARADAAAGRDPNDAAAHATALLHDVDALAPPAGRARYLYAEALRIGIETRLSKGEPIGREMGEAETAYDDAVRFASDPVDALTGSGWLEVDKARDDRPRDAKGANCSSAFGDFDRALAIDAACVDALVGRAQAHLLHAAAFPTEPETLGWLDSAVDDLGKATRLRPHDARIAARLQEAEQARAAAHPPK